MKVQSIKIQKSFTSQQNSPKKLNRRLSTKQTSDYANPGFKGLQGLLFDVDGTIVLNAHLHKEAWLQFCIENNPPKLPVLIKENSLTEEEKTIINKFISGGKTNEVIKKLFGENIPEEELQKYMQKKRNIYNVLSENIQEVKGFSGRFLPLVKDFPKGIASNASLQNIQKYLKALNAERHFKPECIIDATKVKKGKPDKEIYLTAANAIKVKPENCLVFEDAEEGIESAKSAGTKVAGLTTSLSAEELKRAGVNIIIDDYTKITRQDMHKAFTSKECLIIK